MPATLSFEEAAPDRVSFEDAKPAGLSFEEAAPEPAKKPSLNYSTGGKEVSGTHFEKPLAEDSRESVYGEHRRLFSELLASKNEFESNETPETAKRYQDAVYNYNNPPARLESGRTQAEFDAAISAEDKARNPSAVGKVMASTGKFSGAIVGDVLNSPAAIAGYSKPLENLAATRDTSTPLPIDQRIGEYSKDNPVTGTVGKIGMGLAKSAPIMAGGILPSWTQKLMAAGFSADMVLNSGESSKSLGEEMGKPPGERDMDKITTAVSDLAQEAVFAPLAGKHGALDAVESRIDPKSFVVRKLSEQLANEPIVVPYKGPKLEDPALVIQKAADVAWESNAPLTAAALEAKSVTSGQTVSDPGQIVSAPEVNVNEVESGTTIPTNEIKVETPKVEPSGTETVVSTKEQDVARYNEIWKEIASSDVESPEFQKLWGEAESIKNRYGGMPPDLTPSKVDGLPTEEIPLDQLTLSSDVPQFKAKANERGVVKPLGGKFDRRGVAPIQVWRRLNGALEVISGRHRFDLAGRSGEKTIPAQIYNEADGFDVRAAARLDATLNIRDEQGEVSDYANYFKDSGITEADAKEQGFLARAKGNAGFRIARGASEDLFALHQAERISDAQAEAIASVAPGDAGLQAVGIRAALDNKSAETSADLVRLAKSRIEIRKSEGQQTDLFGFDDSAIMEMEAQAKLAADERKEIREQISSVKGAAKKPEVARKLGVDVGDPEGLQKKVIELEARLSLLKDHPELAGKLPPKVSIDTTPKLAPGEKGTGDLLKGQTEDFALTGEKGTDAERLAEQKAKAEKDAAEAKAIQDKQQPDMFGGALGELGMGAAKPGEFKGGGTPTSNKNAVVDAERVKRGLEPMMTALRKTWGDAWDKAMAKIDQDPTFQDRLITELQENPRPLEDWENAALLHRRVDLRNEYEKSARDAANAHNDGRLDDMAQDNARTAMWSDKLSELEAVTKAAGTESGRSLAARKMMMDEDFSLASLEMQKRAAKDGAPLTDGERAELVKIADDYKAKSDALEKHLAERESKVSELEAQRAIDKIKLEAKPTTLDPYIIQVAERIGKQLHKRADAARERIRARGIRFSAGIDPTVLLDIAEIGADHIWSVGLDFAKWSVKMVEDLGEGFRPHLDEAWKASQEHIDNLDAPKKVKQHVKKTDAKAKTDKIGESIKKKVAEGKADSIAIEAQKLARMFVELGVKDRDALIDAVHGELQNYLPEITRRETMDAISGYGKFSQLSKDQISVELRDLKGQMQQVGKLEDMRAGQAPAKTGVERRSPSDEERRLIKQVEEAKKKGGYKVTDPETQLRSALQSAKTRIENQIKDLEHEISTKEKIVRNKSTVPTSPEFEALKTRRDALKAERDEIFGDKLTTDEQRLKAWKTRATNRIAELEAKMAAGDFSTKAKPAPPKFDSEGLKLKYELEQVKKRWTEMKFNDWLAKRSTGQKVLGGVTEVLNTSRAIITSIDFSAVLRQGGFIVFGNPVRGAKSLAPMFRAFASEKGQLRAMEEINSRPNAGLYKQAKLYIAEEGTSLHKMEEAYMSRWAKNIPGVAGSERAYTTFLNKLRADSFDAMVEGMGRDGAVTLEEAKVIANFINVATGRGNLGSLNQAAVAMNTVFFSPRYLASRFQLLAGQPLYAGNARTRVAVSKEYAKFLLGAGVVYALALSATDDKIETDPRSGDFGKVKFGNTRLDPMGGLLQDTVLISRIASGEQKDSHGKLIPVRGDKIPFGKPDSAALIGRFFRTKLSPAIGFGVDVTTGKDVVGNPVTVQSSAQKTLVPIATQDIYKAMMEQGAVRGTALGLLGLFGLGLQTYDRKKKD